MSEPEIIFQPNEGPQTLLLTCPCDEIFFGGARGGGKTFGMIGKVLQHQNLYGVNAKMIWFRQTYDELQGALEQMLKVFPRVGAEYSASARTWTFANGATLKLRYLEREDDARRYQGHEYTLVLFDEAGSWSTSKPIDLLRGSVRTAVPGIRCQMVLSGNPGGKGHGWLKERYIDAAPPCTPIWSTFRNPITGSKIRVSRVFVPSLLSDNPHLLHDPTYIAQLQQTGSPYMVKAWLGGDWSIQLEGEAISIVWFRRYREPPPVFDVVLQSWDTAETDGKHSAWSVCITAGLVGQRIYILDVDRQRLLMPQLRRRHRELAGRATWAGGAVTQLPAVSLVELKSSGRGVADEAAVDEDWPPSCTVVGVKVESRIDKDGRLFREAPMVEGGLVYLPESRAQAPWLPVFEDEIGTLPHAAFKDQGDALSQLLRYVREWFRRFNYRFDGADGEPYVSPSPDEAAWQRSVQEPELEPQRKRLEDVDQGEELWSEFRYRFGL